MDATKASYKLQPYLSLARSSKAYTNTEEFIKRAEEARDLLQDYGIAKNNKLFTALNNAIEKARNLSSDLHSHIESVRSLQTHELEKGALGSEISNDFIKAVSKVSFESATVQRGVYQGITEKINAINTNLGKKCQRRTEILLKRRSRTENRCPGLIYWKSSHNYLKSLYIGFFCLTNALLLEHVIEVAD